MRYAGVHGCVHGGMVTLKVSLTGEGQLTYCQLKYRMDKKKVRSGAYSVEKGKKWNTE